jgi:hypothetical protein
VPPCGGCCCYCEGLACPLDGCTRSMHLGIAFLSNFHRKNVWWERGLSQGRNCSAEWIGYRYDSSQSDEMVGADVSLYNPRMGLVLQCKSQWAWEWRGSAGPDERSDPTEAKPMGSMNTRSSWGLSLSRHCTCSLSWLQMVKCAAASSPGCRCRSILNRNNLRGGLGGAEDHAGIIRDDSAHGSQP